MYLFFYLLNMMFDTYRRSHEEIFATCNLHSRQFKQIMKDIIKNYHYGRPVDAHYLLTYFYLHGNIYHCKFIFCTFIISFNVYKNEND